MQRELECGKPFRIEIGAPATDSGIGDGEKLSASNSRRYGTGVGAVLFVRGASLLCSAVC